MKDATEKSVDIKAFSADDRSFVVFIKRLTDPVTAQLCLFGCHWIAGAPITRPVLILAILTFALTFPGNLPFRYKQIGLFGKIFSGWIVVLTALLLLGWAIKAHTFFDLRPLLNWLIVTPFAIYGLHILSPYVAPRIFRFRAITSGILVGANETSIHILKSLNEDSMSTIAIKAIFDDRSIDRLPDLGSVPLVGDLSEVADYVKRNFVGVIYICLPMSSQPRILHLLNEIRDTTASVYFVPDVFLFDLMQARIDSVGGLPVLAVCESPFHGTVGAMKRWSDVLIATCAIVLTFPLMLAAACAIKVSSPGPIIFKQKRYGLDGRQIEVWKFRSMRVHSEKDGVLQATKNDARLTRVGAFLRRTSIDELPQFFNVLQGRMSVVGPRPHAVSHNETYRKIIPGYMIRHKVKPGITGWAQVNGARGETDTIEKMEARVAFDLYYLRNWSLKFDLMIVFRTILTVIRDPNAY
jgi:putative colanic acid biosysnthesis UDP-glucose lipid carrier transferase